MPSDAHAGVLWPRVIGQERAKRILQRTIASRRLAHAYLFHGPEGVGKDALALELARVVHCERGGEEACGECDSCRRLDTLQHPDVKLVVALPVGTNEESGDPPLARLSPADIEAIQAEYRRKGLHPYHRIALLRANTIKINSIREVRREAAMAPSSGRRRIFIVSRAEEMSAEASNTILKTLEEPAGQAMLILTSSQPDALPATIRSRCQHVRLDLLTEGEIAAALQERDGVEAGRAGTVARLAGGSYARARELLEEDLAAERDEVVAFVRSALAGHTGNISEDAERLGRSKDREGARRFLRMTLLWFRDALVLSHDGPVINVDQTEDLRRFVARFPGAPLPEVIAEIERSLFLLDRNVYLKLILIHLAVRLKHMILPGAAQATAPEE